MKCFVSVLRTAHPGAVLTQMWTPRQQLELIIQSAQTLGEEGRGGRMPLSRRAQAACCHSWGSDPLPPSAGAEPAPAGLSSAGQEHGWAWQQSIHCSFCPRPVAFPLPRAGCSLQGTSKRWHRHLQTEFGHEEFARLEVPSSLIPAAHEESSGISPVDLTVHPWFPSWVQVDSWMCHPGAAESPAQSPVRCCFNKPKQKQSLPGLPAVSAARAVPKSLLRNHKMTMWQTNTHCEILLCTATFVKAPHFLESWNKNRIKHWNASLQ